MLTIGHSTDHYQSIRPTENKNIIDVYQKGFTVYLDMSRRMFGSNI